MHHLYTQIEIAAPIERFWSLLADFPSYGRLNPHVRSVEGKLGVGESLKVFTQPAGGRGIHFRPSVLAAYPNRELRWKGSFILGLPGLFDGEHYFKIEEKVNGVLVFHHGELFSGLLVPLFMRALNGDVKQGFVAANEALK
nr:SRPBCC domain-containing protein [Rhodoferax sp.]